VTQKLVVSRLWPYKFRVSPCMPGEPSGEGPHGNDTQCYKRVFYVYAFFTFLGYNFLDESLEAQGNDSDEADKREVGGHGERLSRCMPA
jgi:hypothetical protein